MKRKIVVNKVDFYRNAGRYFYEPGFGEPYEIVIDEKDLKTNRGLFSVLRDWGLLSEYSKGKIFTISWLDTIFVCRKGQDTIILHIDISPLGKKGEEK